MRLIIEGPKGVALQWSSGEACNPLRAEERKAIVEALSAAFKSLPACRQETSYEREYPRPLAHEWERKPNKIAEAIRIADRWGS